MRLIDADELMKTILDNHYMLKHLILNSTDYGMFTNGIIQAIEEQTTIYIDPIMYGRWKQNDKIGAKFEAENEEFIAHNLDYYPVCGIKILRG